MRHGHLGGVLKVLKNVVFFFTVYIERSICVDSWRVSTQKSTMSFSEVLRFGILFTRHIVDWKKNNTTFFFWAGCLTFLVSCSFQSVFLMIETKQGFSHDRNKPSESHLKCVLYDVFHFFLAEFFLFLVQKTFLRGVVRPCQVLIQMQLLWFYGRSKDKSEQWLWVVIHSYCSVVTLLVFSL